MFGLKSFKIWSLLDFKFLDWCVHLVPGESIVLYFPLPLLCCVKVKQAYVLSFHIILQQSKRHPVLGYKAKKEEFPPWVSEASLAEAAGYMKEE